MYLVEILLPLRRNDGSRQPGERFAKVRGELIERFGGLTAFTRSPAEGIWESETGSLDRDEIVIFEVQAETLDRRWWSELRARLEQSFEQDEVLIRAAAVERL